MIREKQQRIIGKLVSVQTASGIVELTQNISNFTIGGFDDIHQFAQINSYVVIPYQNDLIVAEVLGVKEAVQPHPTQKKDAAEKSSMISDNTLAINFVGELKLNPDKKYEFQFGLTSYPPLYSDVLYIRDQELDVIFKVDEQDIQDSNDHSKTLAKTLKIGTSSVFPDYQVKIDIENFFSKHIAILGNTGSGKSCTISSILQSLYEKNNYSASGSTFIVFDTNGEYLPAFAEIGSNKDIKILHLSPENETTSEKDGLTKESFYLPHWFMNFDEWALLLRASEGVQLPVLRTALNFAKKFADGTDDAKQKEIDHIIAVTIMQILGSSEGSAGQANQILTMLSRYNKSEFQKLLVDHGYNSQFGNFPNGKMNEFFKSLQEKYIIDGYVIKDDNEITRFDFDQISRFLDLAMLYEESHGRTNIRNYCASLLTRAESLLSRKQDFKFLHTKDDKLSLENYVLKILGIRKEPKKPKIKDKQLIIIDLSSYPDEIVEIISAVLSRIIFEALQGAKRRNIYPVHIIVEEAHRYISEKDSDNSFQAKKIFERIAKEGRKYGLSLIVSSQRPSELSKTVLSQCSNFIVHRIMNPEDLSYVRRMTPYISEEILNELPYIPRQQALIFGSAVNMPMMFKVRDAQPKPESADNAVLKHWYKSPNHEVNVTFGI